MRSSQAPRRIALAAAVVAASALSACQRKPSIPSLVPGHPTGINGAGAVVALPKGKADKVVLVCGPAANLGRGFKPARSKVSGNDGRWRELEELAEMDLLLAEEHRSKECQVSIDARKAQGHAIRVIRRVDFSCLTKAGAPQCQVDDLHLAEDIAEVMPGVANG